MEAIQPKRKSKGKKKRSKSIRETDQATTSDYDKVLNSEENELIPSESFFSEHDFHGIPIDCEDAEVEPQTNLTGIDGSAEQCLTQLNNLDINSTKADDFLRKSQLNVFDGAPEHDETFQDETESPEFTSQTSQYYSATLEADTLEATPFASTPPSADHTASEDITETVEIDPVEQLYPSLDDGFYQDLQERSLLRNRQVSQTSCYAKLNDELDVLSMQNAEAYLDFIAPTAPVEDPELNSFEVVVVGDCGAVDCVSVLSDPPTAHHMSLQTLTYDENFENKLQSCYHSNCVSPVQSTPNFEELNKEIQVNELKCYYHNPQLAMNDEFLNDFFSMCDNPNHELHMLLVRYQKSRQEYLSHNSLIESNLSKYHKNKEVVWTFTKDKRIEYGYCADHMKVSYTENCSKAHCHPDVLKDVTDGLTKIQESCSVPLALLQYNWKIAFYHVEEYLVKLTQSCPPLYSISDYVTSYIPGVLIPWDHVNHTSQLRVCISILFYFKRQKPCDEVFVKNIDRWLDILVSMLLRVATLLDHRFLLNHLLRCPTGFSFWGANYLQFVWGENSYSNESIIGNPIVDHFFLMYLTLISPLSQRDDMLENYEPPVQDSDPSEWALLDELGEVECDDKQLLERDYLELLGQLNFGLFYRELVKYSTVDEFLANKHNIKEQEIMTLFSMCLKCISYIKEAYTHLDFTRYRNFCQRNANIMTTFVRFVSDYYYFYAWYGGTFERFSMTADTDQNKLLMLHDHVFQEGFRCLAETSNVSLWQFLADLPYQRISIRVLWKLYGFLHQLNPEKHIKSSVLRDGSPYDIITNLYKTAKFQRRLESLADEDCTFMVNVFCKMALSREIDDNFVKVIGLDIYHIGVTSSSEKQSTDRACKSCLSSIIDHCPEVASEIINNIEKFTLKDLPNNLRIFRGLSLQSWLPSDADFNLLTSWLQGTSITSLTNQLARIIIKGLNWGSYKNQLFIPCEVHRKMAVVIVAAHSYHLPDRPGYLIHSSAPDFAKHVSNSDKGVFVCWCWDVLLMLCLHKSDLNEHNFLALRRAKQLKKQIRRQKSEGFTDDKTSPSSSAKLKKRASTDAFTLDTGEDIEERVSLFVGKWGKFPYKMRKEGGLATLCEALRTNGEMAAFVALSLTTIGHVIIDFQADGIQLLLLLQKNNQYHHRALVHVLSNLFTLTLKNKCLHLLTQLPDFLPVILNLAKAEYSGSFTGRSSKPFTGFIISKLSAAYQSNEADGNLTLKFWIQLFFAIPNFHCEPSIVVILDKVFRVMFRHHGDEDFLLTELRTHLNKCVEASKRNASKILSIVSWFSSAAYVSSLLQTLSNPGNVFWWSYYVTKMECKPQMESTFFQILTEVLYTNPEMTIDNAVRRAHALVDSDDISTVNISNVAIYRWGALLQVVPMEHPLLPYAWREFFKLYFHRVTPEMAGVGYRYFQGMFQVRDLRAMKQRLIDTSKHFELDEESETEITETMIFESQLSHFFLSLSLWTEETRLHEANLFVQGLPQQYSGEKLGDIIQNVEAPWDDMIHLVHLDADISADVNEWNKYTARKYTPRNTVKPDETAAYLAETIYSYVSKNMCEPTPAPELVVPQSHILPGPDLSVPTCDYSSLLSLVAPYFGKLKLHAEQFVEMTNNLATLDRYFLEETPNMFSNRNSQRVEMVTCYSRIGALSRCSGPAVLTINTTQFHENTSVVETIAENRTAYEVALKECREELQDDVCVTAMFVEKIVLGLHQTAPLHQELGRKLFYHVVDHLTTAVWKYPPSQQIFAFSIDCLGQFFIRNNPSETLPLLNNILVKSEFATVLAPLFQPNQGFENFVDVYTHVILSVKSCDTDIGFTVLSKFDIRSWLTTQYSTTDNSKRLLDAIYKAFDVYDFSTDDTTFLMFYDTLKLHLRQVLSNRLCALLQYTIDKTLEISAKHPHHQQIWSEITDVLGMPHCQETLTLNTCHRVLYELSKYFLQYKKSILKATSHDLYSHWHNYTPNLVDLIVTVCTSYIEKASYLRRQKCRPSHPLSKKIPTYIAGSKFKQLNFTPSEEQAACVFMITCAVFAPWILVYEESVLPWSESHLQDAHEILGTFSKMLDLINTQITDVTPNTLERFWWYFMDILGHPIVPSSISVIYYSHFVTLPWENFVPNLEVLHSLLRCVRNNRNNINFVIYVMSKVKWGRVVGELQKESYAFDMMVDVLITFALNQEIFHKFGQDFIVLFRQFKSLDLSLVSDEGFGSIMSRIDKTVQQNQFIEPTTGTGHLIQFMGNLCRFNQHGTSYVKQLTYVKHVVNIIAKISNAQYVEMLVQSVLYNVEQVFYTSCSEQHLVDLTTNFFRLFNTTPADTQTHSTALRKIESALKERGSIKEGFSFAQLSLYYLTALTSSVANIKMQCLVCEVLVEAYFMHCEPTYPVLSVSWTTLRERFHISDMSCENFINHSVLESCSLNIYLYTTHLLMDAVDMDQKYSAVAMLIDASARILPKPGEEQKVLLLWFKIFDILIQLHNTGIRSSAISSIIKQLPGHMLKLAEDRESGGLFNNWFGKKSKYSLEFRLTAKIIATYVLHQVNKDGSLRISGGTRHNLTSDAGKAMDSIRSLVNNRAYAAHIATLQRCIGMVLDSSRTFLQTIELLRFLSMTFYSDKPYLSAIVYSSSL